MIEQPGNRVHKVWGLGFRITQRLKSGPKRFRPMPIKVALRFRPHSICGSACRTDGYYSAASAAGGFNLSRTIQILSFDLGAGKYPPAWSLPPCAAMNMATADRQ
jgi:hypothetical protein